MIFMFIAKFITMPFNSKVKDLSSSMHATALQACPLSLR